MALQQLLEIKLFRLIRKSRVEPRLIRPCNERTSSLQGFFNCKNKSLRTMGLKGVRHGSKINCSRHNF